MFARAHPGSFDYLPQKLKETGVELMAIDTAHSFVQLAPMSMGIPFVHIWNILPFDLTGTTRSIFIAGRMTPRRKVAAKISKACNRSAKW
jgi:hypothetical protein